MQVLQLDIQGTPQRWITPEEAAGHYATDSVVWTLGEPQTRLRGGMSALTGRQSVMDIHPIIALRGVSKVNLFDCVPSLNNRKLFARDRMTCCWCGQVFAEKLLTREHIVPVSRGGEDSWTNTASACSGCNQAKGALMPNEFGKKLVYLPYTPSVWEDFLLRGRNIRADVHEWLASKLPEGSRLN